MVEQPLRSGFAKDSDRLVGQAANEAVTNPENTVFSIKRFMGRVYDEVDNEISEVPYRSIKTQVGHALYELVVKVFSSRDKCYGPATKKQAEDYLGQRLLMQL